MHSNPYKAYKAGIALVESMGEDLGGAGVLVFRHIQDGIGTRYKVPVGMLKPDVVLVAAGGRQIEGSPIADVIVAATSTERM